MTVQEDARLKSAQGGWERKAKMQAQGGGRARKKVGCMYVCVYVCVVRSGVAFRRGGAAKQDEPGFWERVK